MDSTRHLRERFGIKDDAAITEVCCEYCGAWVPAEGTVADVKAGRITVPAHAMDRARNGAPCTYAGTTVTI